VTTPNYYRLRGYAWNPLRFVAGYGGGINVESILKFNSLAHHWKEYSARELNHYFKLLSPVFRCVKCEYTMDEPHRAAVLFKAMKWARPGLHLEFEVSQKGHGITIDPHW
jgi:2-polyprenyl-6-hydroxyphenyl methylase/3-demethylubiquinone-9 3-methyltransferase